MRLPKISILKILLLISLSLVFFTAFCSQTLAYVPSKDETTYSDQFHEGLKSDSWEKSSFDFTTFNNILGSISTNILGSPDEEVNLSMGGSFVGGMGNLITAMYANPAASSKEYLADLGSRLKIIKPTYAQGIGFEGLRPVMGLWTKFRNLAYVFFAIIFVLTGFAVMFRVKINPQVVVTLQNALPKIIISLILVTFSYAIAGFMIDLIYLIMFLTLNLIGIEGEEPIISQSIFGLTTKLLGGWSGVGDTFSFLNTFTKDLFESLPGAITSVMGFAIAGLGTAVIAVAIAFSVFKIFFSLLISYISIIAGVIFSPIMLLLGAIPGQKGFDNWLKLMISNIIPFPLVAAMFGIGGVLMKSVSDGNLWVAPFIGANSTSASIPVLIGLAIIIATPNVIASVQKAIGAPGIGGIASGVATPIAAAGRLVATPITYPVGRARAGMEKAYENQIASGAQEGGIRGAFGKTFKPFTKKNNAQEE